MIKNILGANIQQFTRFLLYVLAVISVVHWWQFVVENNLDHRYSDILWQMFYFLLACFIFLFSKKYNLKRDVLCLAGWILSINLLFVLFEGWNLCYVEYYETHPEYRLDIFRDEVFHRSWAPFYAAYHWFNPPLARLYFLLAAAISLTTAAYFILFYDLSGRRFVFLLLVGYLTASILTALSDGTYQRFSDFSGHYRTFSLGLSYFDSIEEILKKFVSRMHLLDDHNNHYPPGYLILHKLSKDITGNALGIRILAWTTALISIHPLMKLSTHAGLSIQSVRLSLMMTYFSLGFLTFPSISPEMIVMPVSLYAILFLILAFNRWYYAMLWGVMIAVHTFFTFASANIIFFSFVLILAMYYFKHISISVLIKISASGILTFWGLYGLIYLAFDFNIIECFFNGLQNNQHQMTGNPFDDIFRYLLRSTGNLTSYILSTGLVSAPFFIALPFFKIIDSSPLVRSFNLATFSTLLVLSFSGLYFMETERIWIMFTPMISIIAAYSVEKCRPEKVDLLMFFILQIATYLVLEYYLDFCGGCFEYH